MELIQCLLGFWVDSCGSMYLIVYYYNGQGNHSFGDGCFCFDSLKLRIVIVGYPNYDQPMNSHHEISKGTMLIRYRAANSLIDAELGWVLWGSRHFG